MTSLERSDEEYHRKLQEYILKNRRESERYTTLSLLETYYISVISCIIIHAIYFIIFLINNITMLTYFNIGSTVFYVGLYIVAKKGYPYLSFGLMHVEVIVYTIFASVCLGWDSGFSYLVLCFLGTLSIVTFKNPSIKYILGLIDIVVFFALRIYCVNHGAIYSYEINSNFINDIFIYNVIIYLGEVLFLSIYNNRTTRWLQRKLFEQNNFLQDLASKDQLTKLFNRRSMTECLSNAYNESMSKGQTFSIAICDIDNFKQVNDTYGHQCGDFVLSAVASIILNNIRKTDTACRWGGEELLIIFPDTDINNAVDQTERIRKLIGEYNFIYRDYKLKITMTFGVCDSKKFQTVSNMVLEADRLLYNGKRNGKNRVIY